VNDRNRATSAAQKFTALGIATATCVGLVGVIAVRNAQDAQAATTVAVEPQSSVTLEQLDAYAALLLAEQQRLETYRQQLAGVARALAGTSSTPKVKALVGASRTGSTSTTGAAQKPAKAKTAAKKKARAATSSQQAQPQQPQAQPQQAQPQPQQVQPQPQQVQPQPPTQASTRASR